MLGILRTSNFFRTKGTKRVLCSLLVYKFCCQFFVLSCCCHVGRPRDLAVAIVSCLVVVVAAVGGGDGGSGGGAGANAVCGVGGVGVR